MFRLNLYSTGHPQPVLGSHLIHILVVQQGGINPVCEVED